ncbi:hypothetical protein [Limnohabitans sp. B9-3]|uniref:hypothetical protein n=1 Tax=Limnohabitans sp. B9-3 TaxID=1100707 RepID=UPI000C1E096B|nr:hypothetical protein [Limnohabitans sp. B9-3]PIT76505.1 hypothetical protein B9Z42_07455 [Limnohabitans sp. B9-3]
MLFLLGSLRAFGIGRFLMLEYQKSSAANTKQPQSATCFASLANFSRNGKPAKLQRNERTISNLKQRGLRVQRVMIFGTPYEEPAAPATRVLSGEKPQRNK